MTTFSTESGTAAVPGRPATGEQWELRHGSARARVGSVAAVLREFSVGGVRYTESWPDCQTPPMGCGLTLFPWPNRVAGARWRHRGADQQLDVTEPGRGNAIHGLLRFTAFSRVPTSARVPAGSAGAGSGDDAVTLGATAYPQHGWPFTLDFRVRYAVGETGLTVTFEVANAGAEQAVFGCGSHPYLRVGDVPVADCTLTVRARSYLQTDERMIPTATVPLGGPPGQAATRQPGTADSGTVNHNAVNHDAGNEDAGQRGAGCPDADRGLAELPGGALLAGRSWDVGLTDIELAGDRYEHTLRTPDGRGLMLWADPAFAWAQVYTPSHFPAPEGPRPAVAVEPMTCPANALNSGEGLIRLAPGETWHASWGLTPLD